MPLPATESAQPLYCIAGIREIEQAARATLPTGTLMQRAGHAAARAAMALLTTLTTNAAQDHVLVLAGPGDNGGDALEAAALLASDGVPVTVCLVGDRTRQRSDAQHAWQRASNSPLQWIDVATLLLHPAKPWRLIIDGLFGIGLTRPIADDLQSLISHVNRQRCPVLALDIPSGLNADTGRAGAGSDSAMHAIHAIRATHTITFIADKPGLHTGDGRDHAGIVQVAALDIAQQHFPAPDAYLNGLALFGHALQPRRENSHKGSYGDVTVLGGAQGMTGAPILSARAAARCGAGRVHIAFLDAGPDHDSLQPELMCRPADATDFSATVVVAGPGLGKSERAQDWLHTVLALPHSLVLDADALNLIAQQPALAAGLVQRSGATILTPHPLEAARLLAISAAAVQADRPAAARTLAQRYQACVVLKGSGTVIAAPDGQLAINPTGNPGLASAGTGDVLSGVCGALLAQKWSARDAALAAVWLHGKAADELVAQGVGPIGLGASELLTVMRRILNQLVRECAD